MFLFGTTLFANKGNTIGLYLLSALVDLSQVGLYDWGGAGLATLYGYMSSTSCRSGDRVGGYWRAWKVRFTFLFYIFYFLFLCFLLGTFCTPHTALFTPIYCTSCTVHFASSVSVLSVHCMHLLHTFCFLNLSLYFPYTIHCILIIASFPTALGVCIFFDSRSEAKGGDAPLCVVLSSVRRQVLAKDQRDLFIFLSVFRHRDRGRGNSKFAVIFIPRGL